jgi:hypothetical protein
MSVYMRAVLAEWDDPSFADLTAFVEQRSEFRLKSPGDRGWAEFEALNPDGTTVLAGDLTTGNAAREELNELEQFLDDLAGSSSARDSVKDHLRQASAVVGMQILMSVHDDAVAAANTIIDYLEQRPGVLTQVDTVGWYNGPDLILREPD